MTECTCVGTILDEHVSLPKRLMEEITGKRLGVAFSLFVLMFLDFVNALRAFVCSECV